MLNRIRGGTAAVIVEPLGPECGTRPVTPDYNAEVRKLCDEFGALRHLRRGRHRLPRRHGRRPGLFQRPARPHRLRQMHHRRLPDGGRHRRAEEHHDDAGRRHHGSGTKRAFVGGTLSANPLSCVAGYYAIQEMARTNAAVIAGRAGDRLPGASRRSWTATACPSWSTISARSSICRPPRLLLMSMRNPIKLLREVHDRRRLMEEMGAAYLAHGILTVGGSRIIYQHGRYRRRDRRCARPFPNPSSSWCDMAAIDPPPHANNPRRWTSQRPSGLLPIGRSAFMNSTGEDSARRPIASRSSFWAIAIARYLGRAG